MKTTNGLYFNVAQIRAMTMAEFEAAVQAFTQAAKAEYTTRVA